MSSLPIESNVAANDTPISIVLKVDFEEEDLEKIQHKAATTQKKIVDEATARLAIVKVQNEKKCLDQEKKEADDKAKKDKEVKDVEETWKAEAWKMEKEVSLED